MSKPIVRICPNTAENLTHVVKKLTDNGAALRYTCSLEQASVPLSTSFSSAWM